MIKNYLIINIVLGVVVLLIVGGIISNLTRPLDDFVSVPTFPESEPSPTSLSAQGNILAPTVNTAHYDQIYQRNAFHPERIVPPTPTVVPKVDTDQFTPTPEQFDCAQSQITLSGIVSIENEKSFCFLSHPKETENVAAIFYLEQSIGPYKITEIHDDGITLTASDGSICELLLFDFSEAAAAAPPQGQQPPQRTRPTPVPRRRNFQRPTPRQLQPSR